MKKRKRRHMEERRYHCRQQGRLGFLDDHIGQALGCTQPNPKNYLIHPSDIVRFSQDLVEDLGVSQSCNADRFTPAAVVGSSVMSDSAGPDRFKGCCGS